MEESIWPVFHGKDLNGCYEGVVKSIVMSCRDAFWEIEFATEELHTKEGVDEDEKEE